MNPTHADDEQRGRPVGRQQDQPDRPGGEVADGRERRHPAEAHEPVLDDPRAAAELGRRDVRVVGARTGVEDVVGDVEPELDERRADDRQQRGDEVERPVRRGDQDAQDDRHDRRGEERQAGGAQRQEPERELRAGPASRAPPRARRSTCATAPTERSEYSKKGTSLSSQPHARVRGQGDPAVQRRRAAPDRHVAALVVAVAGLRPDVRPGQGDLAVGRDGQAGRSREPGDQLDRADPGVDGDADGIPVVVDPGRDLVGERGELVEPGAGVETVGAAHHAASPVATSVSCGAVEASPSDQYRTRRGVTSISARSKKSGSATRALRNETIDGSLASQIGQQPLPAAVRVVVDDPGVALDRARGRAARRPRPGR